MGADGLGSITVGAASNAQLLSGSRTLYLSTFRQYCTGRIHRGRRTRYRDRGESRSPAPRTPPGIATFWGAGLRVDFSAVSGYSGALVGARTGQTDVEQTLQSAWRRRLRLHRHQLLFAGRRWQRNCRSHPGRARRRRQGVHRRRHQPDRFRRLRNLFRSAGPGADRYRRLSEPARRGQRRQFRARRESNFSRRIRHVVRHRPRQERPDRRASVSGLPERCQRARSITSPRQCASSAPDSSMCWSPSRPPVPRRPSS